MASETSPLVAYFWSGESLRSRSVGSRILSGTLAIPPAPPHLVADWNRDAAEQLALQPGDVEALSLPRARRRWPQYGQCVQAVAQWLHAQGMGGLLESGPGPAHSGALSELHRAPEMALMACRGAHYHHDGVQYGGFAFCNVFVGEDQGLDVHFPHAGVRIPLQRGTVVVFDTCQPHAVIPRGANAFDAADFPPERDCTSVFLTWELPVEAAQVAHALHIAHGVNPAAALNLHDAQLHLHGQAAQLCPQTGHWIGNFRYTASTVEESIKKGI
jgi:hypothetical protein